MDEDLVLQLLYVGRLRGGLLPGLSSLGLEGGAGKLEMRGLDASLRQRLVGTSRRLNLGAKAVEHAALVEEKLRLTSRPRHEALKKNES